MTDIYTDILNGNVKTMVPEHEYEKFIKPSLEEIKVTSVKFNPDIHLQYYADEIKRQKFENTRRLTMEELGKSNKNQITHIGISDPFPLFTSEAIAIMKQEILNKEIFLKYARYLFNSTGKDCCIRGYSQDTPFTRDAWTHPKTQELINLMAGVELEVAIDYEIAHVNISMKDPKEVEEELSRLSTYNPDTSDQDCAVGWHVDSYPMVCVLMLSDTTNMVGGSTSIRMGKDDNGKIVAVPGPTSGSACVLQGGLIEHMAPNPMGVTERITMVTSYRPKDHKIPDMSNLHTVKPEVNYGSRYNDFYPEWVNYRSKLITERLSDITKEMSEKFNKEKVINELKDLEKYLVKTYKEMEVNDEEWQEIKENFKRFD